MNLRWLPVPAHLSLLAVLALLSAPEPSYYLYFVSLVLLAVGIRFERTWLIYISGLAGFLSVLPLAVYHPQHPVVVLIYASLALASIDLSLEAIGTGYLTVEWRSGSMRSWMMASHLALLGIVFAVCAFLVQAFLFFQLVTNDILLLLILAVLSMAGVAFYIRMNAMEPSG